MVFLLIACEAIVLFLRAGGGGRGGGLAKKNKATASYAKCYATLYHIHCFMTLFSNA